MPDDFAHGQGSDVRIPEGAVRIASPAEVAAAFDRLAAAISARLAGRDPVLVAVLEGGRMPADEISRRLGIPHVNDTLRVGRYGRGATGGELRWQAVPETPLAGRSVLVVDDILDEGVTLAAVANHCREAGAEEVLTCVLTVKDLPDRAARFSPDFVGLLVPDRYIVGCGMDYQGRWRELPGLYALEEPL
ncbi:hypoxanthine-guanine phosphoribosyltransferase [Lentisalinibacter salinarum]|uniref:hypoxanthine-guanine phosphoribosyltransferase n=1 Tax=Lentisalinibacter salinarum TaxID=2992239 RepID=UPI003863C2DD